MRVIAEIGSNWKDKADCLWSVAQAKAAGADAVKFQLIYPGDLRPDSSLSLIPPLQEIHDACMLAKIDLMCTAFSPNSVYEVDEFVKVHKVASSEITDLYILQAINKCKKPVYLSTGGATFDQIELALRKLSDCPVTIMYCVVSYPARIVDFRHLELMKEYFGYKYDYGYSDHSTDILNVPVLARKHGSSVLEKHVNFTPHTDTPDAPHSLSGDEFAMMVKRLKGDLSPRDTFQPNPWQRTKTEHGYSRPK